jgi:hypothetical protein
MTKAARFRVSHLPALKRLAFIIAVITSPVATRPSMERRDGANSPKSEEGNAPINAGLLKRRRILEKVRAGSSHDAGPRALIIRRTASGGASISARRQPLNKTGAITATTRQPQQER